MTLSHVPVMTFFPQSNGPVASAPDGRPSGPQWSDPRAPQVLNWAQQQGERLRAQAAALAAEREESAQLLDWITAAEEALGLRDQEPLPEEVEQLEDLSAQHAVRDPKPGSPRGPSDTLSSPGRALWGVLGGGRGWCLL